MRYHQLTHFIILLFVFLTSCKLQKQNVTYNKLYCQTNTFNLDDVKNQQKSIYDEYDYKKLEFTQVVEEPTVVATSVEQLKDISPDHGACIVLESLIDRYEIRVPVYSDNTFRGNTPVSRFESAALFNRVFNKIIENQNEINKKYVIRGSEEEKIILDRLEALLLSVKEINKQIREIDEKQGSKNTNNNLYFTPYESNFESPNNFLAGTNKLINYSNTEINSISQLKDITPGDWAFETLRSLIERYKINAIVYPDKTFKGNRYLNRYELVFIFNNVLDRFLALQALPRLKKNAVTIEEFNQFIEEQDKIETEIRILQKRIVLLQKNNLLSDFSLEKQTEYRDIGFNIYPVNIDKQKIIAQVTSTQQFNDLSPDHWAYNDIKSLVEDYGCYAGYPDGTIKGTNKITRYEFIAQISACLHQAERLFLFESMQFLKSELTNFKIIQDKLAKEVSQLQVEIKKIEDGNTDSMSF